MNIGNGLLQPATDGFINSELEMPNRLTRTNRLIHEKSPYLLQHAHNPVDWYPWGEAAFNRARAEDRPIFLSIGYSTCHWCHVMEKESFEDAQVAALLNDVFVCIKVDREERPDIDDIYMNACQLVTGQGGWPLTIMMLPDQRPFYAATYLPKSSRYGRIGMIDLIPTVQQMWSNERPKIVSAAESIAAGLKPKRLPPNTIAPDTRLLDDGFRALLDHYDHLFGGFGTAPKFPTPHNLLFLLRRHHAGEAGALPMVENTLAHMRNGGIYDQLGFGFHRYSTDRQWLTPHFEKMLYDQALLMIAYAEAFQATNKAEYAQTVDELFTYVTRDMTSPEGGFFSAEDADSEGEEGKFYIWREKELRDLLVEDADLFISAFGVIKEGNFEKGRNILHRRQITPITDDRLNSLRLKALHARNLRPRPLLDDKILTDWNGLMIASLAFAGRACSRPEMIAAAERTARFIPDKMSRTDGRLRHRYREGQAAVDGFIDDYAFTAWGMIELYQATLKAQYLQQAIRLSRLLIEWFWDDESGGFFSTASDAERLLVRSKNAYDGAIPSGNSVAAYNMIRLGRLTGDPLWEDKSANLFRAFSHSLSGSPSAHTFMLTALQLARTPSTEVVIVAGRERADVEVMLETLNSRYLPNVVILLIDEHNAALLRELAPFTAPLTALENRATAYVCRNFTCSLPTTDPQKLWSQILNGSV